MLSTLCECPSIGPWLHIVSFTNAAILYNLTCFCFTFSKLPLPEVSDRLGHCLSSSLLPLRIIVTDTGQYWLCVREELDQGFEHGGPDNVEEAHLGPGHSTLQAAVHEGTDWQATFLLHISLEGITNRLNALSLPWRVG